MSSEVLRTVVTQLAGRARNDDDDCAVEQLNDDQRVALLHVLRGRNVFVTGSAGTGKSYWTRCLVRLLQRRRVRVALTATTALAASNLADKDYETLEPMTIHRFAGIGLAREDIDELVRMVKRNKFVVQRLRDVDLWVIDEVSMLDPLLMVKLDALMRAVRERPHEEFGGVQVVFVGDFYQIPPVLRDDDMTSPQRRALLGEQYCAARYCFELPLWRKTIDVECLLRQVFRQSDDAFVHMLQEVRHGCLSAPTLRRFTDRSEVMLLYDLEKLAVEHWGAEKAEQIRAAARSRWTAFENGVDLDTAGENGQSVPGIDWSCVDAYMRSCSTFEEGEALVRTLPEQVVPPAYRIYVSPIEPTQLVAVNRRVHEENERRLAMIEDTAHVYRSHVELKGMTTRHRNYDEARKQFVQEFERNVMAPTTLTLKRGAQVMLLANLEPPALVNGRRGVIVDFVQMPMTAVTVAQSAGDATSALRATSDEHAATLTAKATTVPLVRFDNGVERAIQLHVWKRKRRYGAQKVEASFYQLPLMLSYALSIHKSQGMSISALKVDLADVFESGQSYVALSRAVSLDRLVVSGFDAQMFASKENQPNRTVIDFYERIERAAPACAALVEEDLRLFTTAPPADMFIGQAEGSSAGRGGAAGAAGAAGAYKRPRDVPQPLAAAHKAAKT